MLWRDSFLLVLTLGLGLSGPLFAGLELEIETVDLGLHSQVDFKLRGSLDATDTEKTAAWGCSLLGDFEVCVDLSSTFKDIYLSGYHYIFYARSKNDMSSSQWAEFDFLAKQAGSFLDQEVDISFLVKDAGIENHGSITLPIYSTSGEDRFSYEVNKSPWWVQIGQSETIQIKLTSKLDDLALELYEEKINISPYNTIYWNEEKRTALLSPSVDSTGKLILQKKGVANVNLAIEATRDALKAAIFPRRALGDNGYQDSSQDGFVVEVPYSIQGLNESQIMTIHIPVVFYPSLFALVFCAAIGGVVGSGVYGWFQKITSVRVWLHGLIAGFFFAGIAELVGILLVRANSELRILGIDVDPHQVTPAFVLGILCGLFGIREIDLLLKHFGYDPLQRSSELQQDGAGERSRRVVDDSSD